MDIIKAAVPGTFRDLNTVTAEIKILRNQAQQMALSYAIEIGRRLNEGKSYLPAGKSFEDWAMEEFEFKKSSAYNFIKIFEEYGSEQVSLFGEPKFQALGKLSYTKALRLLAIPEDEREEFAEQNDVENISSRELDRLIKEREQAEKEKKAAEQRAEQAEAAAKKANAQLNALREETDDIYAKATDDATERVRDRIDMLREKLGKADAEKTAAVRAKDSEINKLIMEKTDFEMRAKKADRELEALRKQSEKELETERAAAEAKFKEFEERLKEAESKPAADGEAIAEKARAEAEAEAQEKIAALEKKLALAGPEVQKYKFLFGQCQSTVNEMLQLLKQIKETEPETAGKLNNATAQLFKAIANRLEGMK